MRRRSNAIAASLTVVFLAAVSGLACGPKDGGGGNSVCDALTNYQATVAGPLSFATDIYPIMSDQNLSNGCGRTAICHGVPPAGLDDVFNPTKFMQFVFGTMDAPTLDPVMARANLLMASVNAPGMMRVVPGNVGQSVLAYKISDRAGLACINSMCVFDASVGNNQPCGDPMPSTGAALSAANRTKILDWIKLGAAD